MMHPSSSGRAKLYLYRVNSIHATVDKNLQIQIPEEPSQLFTHSAIYSHYLGLFEAPTRFVEPSHSEEQLRSLARSADHLYTNWSKGRHAIMEEIEKKGMAQI